jgi:transcriptional regulator with XRE-family HTH domain
MKQYSDFGSKARTIMLKKNITMTFLAKEIGVCTPYMSEILKGTRKGENQKVKIAEILGMD